MNVEIRITTRDLGPGYGEVWEELWIDGEWKVSYPRQAWCKGLPGNDVAHCICLALRNMGMEATYKMIDERSQSEG